MKLSLILAATLGLCGCLDAQAVKSAPSGTVIVGAGFHLEQTVCIYGPFNFTSPEGIEAGAIVNKGNNPGICLHMRGERFWLQQWYCGIGIANNFGEEKIVIRWGGKCQNY